MTTLKTRLSLLAAIQAGNEIRWHEFYYTYKGFVLAVAQRVVLAQGYYASETDLADLIQEVMLELAKPGPLRFDPARGRFRSWFSGIISNKLKDLIRRKARQQKGGPSLSEDLSPADEQEISVDVFSDIWFQEWSKQIVWQALEQLKSDMSPKVYRAFELTELEGWAAAETARELGITTDKVYMYKHRCGVRLREIVAKMNTEI